MKPRILVAYSLQCTHIQTIFDYLCSMGQFLDAEIDYLHVTYDAVLNCSFDYYDVIINECCVRFMYDWCSEEYKNALRRFKGVKVLIVQDEYDRTNELKKS